MTLTAAGDLRLRVMVEDVWDAVNLDVPATTVVGDVKAMALRQAGVPGEPAGYMVKFRGAELDDEDRSLADVGMVDNAGLIVLARRRRPVR